MNTILITTRMLRILLTAVLVLYNVSSTSSHEQGGQTQPAATSCLAPKPKAMGGARYMKNGTNPGEYIVGANSWHIPVLDYLTNVAIGPTYDPPIRFRRVTANMYLTTSSIQESIEIGYDFMIANPHASSCYESERAAVSLATQIIINENPQQSPEQQPQSYNLTKYGATLYVLKNRTDIKSIQDIKGKKMGTNKITNLAT